MMIAVRIAAAVARPATGTSLMRREYSSNALARQSRQPAATRASAADSRSAGVGPAAAGCGAEACRQAATRQTIATANSRTLRIRDLDTATARMARGSGFSGSRCQI